MNKREDIVLQSLYQDRDKLEVMNKKLQSKLKIIESNLPISVLDDYRLEKINGIYEFKDQLGNTVKSSDIENRIERDIFLKASMDVDDYNRLYRKMLNNTKTIESIVKEIEDIKNK